MTQWVESIEGKWFWFMSFSAEEMILLRKYHVAFSRMTKMDLRGIL